MRSLSLVGLALGSLLMTACSVSQPPSSISEAATATRSSDDAAPATRFRIASVSPESWDQLRSSHVGNLKVRWPDGRLTQAVSHKPEELDRAFAFAPDHHLDTHPVKLASSEWTTEAGTLSGTFTQPLVNEDGTVTAPTGRAFSLWLVTVSHWKDGAKDQEYVFWDSGAKAKSIGL